MKLRLQAMTTKGPELVRVVGAGDQPSKPVDLPAELDLGRDHVGILQDLVGDSPLLRDATEVLQLQRSSVPREAVEVPASDGLSDPRLGDPRERVHEPELTLAP